MNSGLNGLPSHFGKPSNVVSNYIELGPSSISLSGVGTGNNTNSATSGASFYIGEVLPSGSSLYSFAFNANGIGPTTLGLLGTGSPAFYCGSAANYVANVGGWTNINGNAGIYMGAGNNAPGNVASVAVTSSALAASSSYLIGFTSGNAIGSLDTAANRAAAGVYRFNNGSSNTGGFLQWGGQARVSSQFDKVTDTTLANIPGLSVTVASGRTYTFRAYLHVSPDTVGGQKYAMAGTCTATSVIYQINTINNTTNANIINSRQTALGGSAGVAGGTADYTEIVGTITVNAGGTLTVQFAQNAASGTSSVLVGSFMEVNDAP